MDSLFICTGCLGNLASHHLSQNLLYLDWQKRLHCFGLDQNLLMRATIQGLEQQRKGQDCMETSAVGPLAIGSHERTLAIASQRLCVINREGKRSRGPQLRVQTPAVYIMINTEAPFTVSDAWATTILRKLTLWSSIQCVGAVGFFHTWPFARLPGSKMTWWQQHTCLWHLLPPGPKRVPRCGACAKMGQSDVI